MVFSDGPDDAPWTLLLAHGAGAGADTPFMQSIAAQVAAAAIHVVRFEFPYMEKSRELGKSRPPDRAPVLEQAFVQQIQDYQRENTRLAIGGKSMGGRIATMVAAGSPIPTEVAAVVCLGYPFHPPGKPDKLRTDHLQAFPIPALILQGERDTFGNREQVVDYDLSPAIAVEWITDGDHSFKPRKASGVSLEDNLTVAADRIVQFLQAID